MDTRQLLRLVRRDAPIVRGVFARDTLPETIQWPSGYIINTDPVSEPGEHWVAVFIDHNGVGEYFDSFGLPPLHDALTLFLNKHCVSWTFNSRHLQDVMSMACGLYCVYYLRMRCRGVARERLLRIFSDDYSNNDAIVRHLVKINDT